MVYLKSVENVITLGKLIGLFFLFCLPLLSILFFKTKRNDLARPVIGTIFLVILPNPLVLSSNAWTFGKWSPEEWNGIAFHEVLWSLLFAKTRQTRRPRVTSTDGC